MGEIMFNFLLQLPRCNIIPKHLYIIYVSQLKFALCKFVNMKLKFTVKQSETNYRQQQRGPISFKCVRLKPVYQVTVYQFDIVVRGLTQSYCGNTVVLGVFLDRTIFITGPVLDDTVHLTHNFQQLIFILFQPNFIYREIVFP